MAGVMDSFNVIKPFDESNIDNKQIKETMMNTLMQLESGGRPNAFFKDYNDKPSIGMGQWNGPRAERLIQNIRIADPAIAAQYIAEVDKADSDYILKNKEKIQQLLGTDVGIDSQKKQMSNDYAGYMQHAAKRGVVGTVAQGLSADLMHRFGMGGFERFLTKDGPTTLDGLYANVKKYEDMAREQGGKNAQFAEHTARRFAKYGEALGGKIGATMDLIALGKKYQELKANPQTAFEVRPDSDVSPEITSLMANKLGIPSPDYFKNNSEIAEPYESPYLAQHDEFRNNLKAMFLPKQEAGKPFNFGGLIKVILSLFNG